ncbi:MAG: hypothetical protein K2X87_09215 [Gemmataceae bacterium]|nr:hypothetical protein [Gemmataceae bacterium]
MAISYPLTLPTSVGLTRFRPVHVHATATEQSPWTLATLVQEHPGKLLGAECTVAMAARAKAAPWQAFKAKLKGPKGTFLMGDPSARTPQGVATGTPRVNGSVAKQAEEITTKGWTASVTGILKEGDYIQIGNRLYQVLQDVNSNGSGQCTLDVFPPVREPLTDNTLILTANTVGLFRLTGAEQVPYEVTMDGVYAVEFAAVEAL